MKKKGLLISTIVMVVVLIAALTTSTYAWFSTSSVTSISGFDVTVTSNNAVNIGLKGDSYSDGSSPDEFVSGTCIYNAGAEKAWGHWTSDNPALAPNIDNTGVYWGKQSKAVGFTTTKQTSTDGLTYSDVGYFVSENGTAIKANGNKTKIEALELAYPNGTSDDDLGDYAYLFIGAQMVKAVREGTNKFYVVVQPQGGGKTIGMAAAVHVAYRTKLGTGSWSGWTEKGVYDSEKTFGTSKESCTETIIGDYSGSEYKLQNATKIAATDTEPVKTSIPGAAVCTIDLSSYNSSLSEQPIDQIEIIIYLAGRDDDCVDSAKNGTTMIGLFFGAQEAAE